MPLNRRAVVGAGTLAGLVVAVGPPIDAASADRFSIHMGQHLALILLAAPLAWWLHRLVPNPLARRFHHPAVPLVAAAVHGMVLVAWHLPGVYGAALGHPGLHATEHLGILGSAAVVWASVAAARQRSVLTALIALLMLTAVGGGIGSLLTFAPEPIYRAHVGAGIADQQVAGLLMWVVGGLMPLAAAAWLLATALRRDGRSSRQPIVLRAGPLVAVVVGLLALAACGGRSVDASAIGDADTGKLLLESYGCGACHSIPGVRGADATAAPTLHDIDERAVLAGRIANTPENLIRWIQSPTSIDPETAMPDFGIGEEQASDIAAYLLEQSG